MPIKCTKFSEIHNFFEIFFVQFFSSFRVAKFHPWSRWGRNNQNLFSSFRLRTLIKKILLQIFLQRLKRILLESSEQWKIDHHHIKFAQKLSCAVIFWDKKNVSIDPSLLRLSHKILKEQKSNGIQCICFCLPFSYATKMKVKNGFMPF